MSYLCALSENVWPLGIILSLIIGLLIILLTIFRFTKDLDIDEFYVSMKMLIPLLIVALLIASLPSPEHVLKVQFELYNQREISK